VLPRRGRPRVTEARSIPRRFVPARTSLALPTWWAGGRTRKSAPRTWCSWRSTRTATPFAFEHVAPKGLQARQLALFACWRLRAMRRPPRVRAPPGGSGAAPAPVLACRQLSCRLSVVVPHVGEGDPEADVQE